MCNQCMELNDTAVNEVSYMCSKPVLLTLACNNGALKFTHLYKRESRQ